MSQREHVPVFILRFGAKVILIVIAPSLLQKMNSITYVIDFMPSKLCTIPPCIVK